MINEIFFVIYSLRLVAEDGSPRLIYSYREKTR